MRIDFPVSAAYIKTQYSNLTVLLLRGTVLFLLPFPTQDCGSFLGRSDGPVVWVYGSDSLSRFNEVVVLGNQISSFNMIEHNGLMYTDFNRTLADGLANESILDMQGITEALSEYYFSNGESFEGIFVPPE